MAETSSNSDVSVEGKKSPTCVVDLSEDSGFSNISVSSSSSDISKTNNEKINSTIGEGIQFADHTKIAEDLQKQKTSKSLDPEILAERRRAQEAYEEEIKEQQYKRLMHLLNQSKAFSSFIAAKFEADSSKDTEKNKENGSEKPKPSRGRKRGSSAVKKAAASKSKRSRKKLNLSEEEIKEELASMSDEEPEGKENDNSRLDNSANLKYFKGELRDYQKVGLNWLKVLYENGMNGILGDEMGLGKTIQVIALFAHLIEKQIPGPYMIIVPLSTLPNWISEFERFAPQLPVTVYYGSKVDRPAFRPNVSRKVRIGSFSTHPIVLMTYQVPYADSAFLRQFNWRYIVIDEAQKIKNFECQLFKILKNINSVNRLLLTGTPLQNNLSELWSLLNFLLPDIFNNLAVFEAWFDAKQVQSEEGKNKFLKQEQEKHVVTSLREILQPFMLRRLKEDVCPDIPPFKEVMVYAPLTTVQYELYRAIINRDLEKIYKVKIPDVVVDVDGKRPKRRCTQKFNFANLENLENFKSQKEIARDERMLEWNQFTEITEETAEYFVNINFGNRSMLYRHVVNHPYIIHYPLNDCGLGKIDENIVKASGKLLVLDALLKKLKARGHKVLLFSTMKLVLNIIEDYLSLREYEYVRLDGDIHFDKRKNNIDRFQNDQDVFLFLITTKAGAVGLNLAAADTVIIYDSDWNPQNDIQAMARCHRIGQTKPVVVYRLCTKGTIDEEVVKRANAKRILEKAVISKDADIVSSEEGLNKLKKLFEENSYKIVDSKKEVYTDAELDDLLDRSDLVMPAAAK